MKKIEEKYISASYILEDIWNNMDWEHMNQSRKQGILEEFTNKVRALSRCYADIYKFLDKLCKIFNSRITQKTIINLKKTEEIMEIFRYNTQIPVVIFQIKKQEIKKQKLLINNL